MKRQPFRKSEFEDHQEWEEEELEKHPDRANESASTDTVSKSLLQRTRERNLQKLKEEGIGYSKKPKKPDF